MTRLMRTASALTIAAGLAAMPLSATAQEQDTEVENAAEQAGQEVAQETQEAAQELEQAGEEAAQEVEEAGSEVAQETEEAAQETESMAEGAEAEMSEEMTEGTETTEGAEMAEGEQQPAEVPGTIVMQDENSILASELMGARVYNTPEEAVGDIDDVIVSLDGTVEGVVIGVGGFLGLGEKRVAVEMEQIDVQMNEDNEPQLFLNATREELEAAPEFITAAEQQRAAEQEEMQQDAQPQQDPAMQEEGAMETEEAGQ